ncbi:LLM class flavin-dependent oxidoreductase [Mycetocola lacteus]|uniref:LLM class flavin-dependent oxidoreductase n=1 Tax=Mycetocola lacteus TaxID=76637 RepID=A0A3L7ANW2_9MICO|nr:LLM class flavin-dependent oxidoreductase [Mycetocola lacteus]RLP82106.1 LLM class flavin-dependent oxidoreductase [Mycetocola lacteus]
MTARTDSIPATPTPFTVGIVLDPGGPLPPDTAPALRFDRAYWAGLVHAAEGGGYDQVLFAGSSAGAAPGLDPVLLASALAPAAERIALVPEVITGVLEPFHLAAAVQTLDHLSRGRAGWLVRPGPAGAGGVREDIEDASETIAASRLLFDSWEEDAEIRDVATGRYIDRDRVHRVDYRGSRFTILGPSYVPRSPQGSPPLFIRVPALSDAEAAGRLARAERDFALEYADTIILDATSGAHPEHTLRALREAGATRIVIEVVPPSGPEAVSALAERALRWHRDGVTGILLRPTILPGGPADLDTRLLAELWGLGLPPTHGRSTPSLRALLGLQPARNAFAEARLAKVGTHGE